MIDTVLWVALGAAIAAAVGVIVFALAFVLDWHPRRAVVAAVVAMFSAVASWRDRR